MSATVSNASASNASASNTSANAKAAASGNKPANPSASSSNNATPSAQTAAAVSNAAAAVAVNSNQENVVVSVGDKKYTCVIRVISDKDQAAQKGEIVVTKNGQKYAVTVTDTSKVNGGRIKRVTRNQKKKKTRSTRK